MTAHIALGNFLTAISYQGRNPSWAEFETGSPAERRAILARWLEIQKEGLSDDWAAAVGRYGRAMAVQRKRSSDEGEFSAQERFERGMTPAGDTSEDQGL